jgi:hypothetical protein
MVCLSVVKKAEICSWIWILICILYSLCQLRLERTVQSVMKCLLLASEPHTVTTLFWIYKPTWRTFFTFFNVFIFPPLHVSSDKRSSSGGNNCINTFSGITHWQGQEETPDQHAGQSPCQCFIPEDVLTELFPPDDERFSLETCRGVKINTL